MYQLSFDGLRDAVKKSKDAAELKDLLDVPSINTAQTMWASVNNTIMDIALEKNHKNIIWDIKREVATALTVGDRYDTMADRLAESLNGNYKKANLIARTEIGRVREAGHLAAAKDINETISQGSSGLRMVKKWMSMKDMKVRDQHQEMHGKIVEMDEPFELPDGTETQAPKQSGVARHDCNCRCTCLYPLMDDAMFYKATGKHFKDVSANMSRRHNYEGDTWPKEGTPISAEDYAQLKDYADTHGVRLVSFENFDGDPALVRDMIDGISDVSTRFSIPGLNGQKVLLHNSYTLDDDDFAMTKGRNIYINNFAFRDKATLQKEYAAKVAEGWFVKGTDYRAIAYHEMGHVLTISNQIPYSKLWDKITPGKTTAQRYEAISNGLSEYAATIPLETIAEAFTAYTCLKKPPKMALQILETCGIL